MHTVNQPLAGMMERRRAKRFALQAPVLLKWRKAVQQQQSAGFTRDVGTTSAFITCEAPCQLEVGTEVAIEVLLPALQGTSAPARLHGRGRVVRRSGVNEPRGFVLLTEFELVSSAA